MNKRILELILLVLLLPLSSCQDAQAKETTPSESQDISPSKPIYEVLNDFEDYKSGVEPLSLLNYFGKVSLNDDLQYVHSGKKSLKMIPEGCLSEGSYNPILKQPFLIETNQINQQDISQFQMITSNIYNSSLENVNLSLSLQFFGGYVANKQDYVLHSGWNTIVYTIDPQIIEISYDIYNCKGLLYTFDRPKSSAQAPTLYLDDIRIYKTNVPYHSLDTSVDLNEICSFDKLYQQYVLIPNVTYPDFAPSLEICEDLAYVKAGKSLKVCMPKNDGSFTTYAYTGFSLNSKFVHSAKMDQYDQNDYFSFWVYNSGTSQQRLFLEFFDYGGIRYYKKTDIYIPAGKWSEVRIQLSELSGGTPSLTTGNAGEIYINWEINSLFEDRVLYFDEFRIVK